MGCVKSPKFLREQVEQTFNIPDMLLKSEPLPVLNPLLCLFCDVLLVLEKPLIHHSEDVVLREADAFP